MAAQLRQLASATEAEDLRGEMDGLAGKMESKVSDISVLCEAIQPFRNAKQVQNLLKDPDLKPKLEEACPLMDAETLAPFCSTWPVSCPRPGSFAFSIRVSIPYIISLYIEVSIPS